MILRCLIALAFFLFVLTAVYLGLNTAEKGIQELMGLDEGPGAIYLEVNEEGITFTWAGNEYVF